MNQISSLVRNNLKSLLFVGLLVGLTLVSITSSYLMNRTPSQAPTRSEAAEVVATDEDMALPTLPTVTPTPSPTPTLPTESESCQLTIRVLPEPETLTATLTPSITLISSVEPTPTPSPAAGAPQLPTSTPTPQPSLTPTLSPTPTPTLVPSPTPTPARVTPVGGVAQLPESGLSLPTLVFLLLGIFLLLGGTRLVVRG